MKNTTIYMLTLMLVGIIGCAGLVSAFMQEPANRGNNFVPGFMSEEQSSAVQQAIEDNNFEAWKAAITETLTEENFDKLVERQKASDERMQLQNAVRQAIANKDYAAYKAAVNNLNSQNVMSEEQFNAMAERYNATDQRTGVGPGFGPGGIEGRHRMNW
jgi:hypothetical protein